MNEIICNLIFTFILIFIYIFLFLLYFLFSNFYFLFFYFLIPLFYLLNMNCNSTFANWPQKYQKRRSNTCQIAYWAHTHITHSHLLKGEDAPMCPSCKVQLTTKHILLNCNNLKHIRTKYYQARNLRDIFKNTNPENIFNF